MSPTPPPPGSPGWSGFPASGTIARLAAGETARRLHVVLVLAGLVGVATGLAVAAFEWFTREQMFRAVTELPLALAAAAPTVGLALAVLIIRRTGGDPATTDAYVRAYHEPGGRLSLRRLPTTALACLSTLGFGAAMGYEGPAIHFGATIGSSAERRFTRRFRQDDAKVLMVAGAAAGVAAIFKAPLTGVVFALEVPYHQDLARRALLPALVAAGMSYLTFVAFVGTEPVLAYGGPADFELRHLLGGVLVGVACGALARGSAWLTHRAKRLAIPIAWRVAIAGAVLTGLAVLADHLFDGPVTLGSGYDAIAWASDHREGFGMLVALFVLRLTATVVTVAGGGVGGLFIPLVTQGAIVGLAVQAVVGGHNPDLFPVVGIAAFLGGGYRTPLAGVAFVAEATGRPGFVVPALLASAAAQLSMGRWSFSPYQRTQRQPERVATTRLLVREIMSANPDTIDASWSLDDAARRMMREHRRWAPVVEQGRYCGLLAIADIAEVRATDWPEMLARDAVRTEVRAVEATETVHDVALAIREGDIGAVAVVENDLVVGVVTLRDIAGVERLLDRLGEPDAPL
jgi:CIC family chloride channel protein